jgi:hypothetical protein
VNGRYLLALCCCLAIGAGPAGEAAAQNTKIINRDLVDHEFIFGLEALTKTQRVIPADDRGVMGTSRRSKLTAHASVSGSFITNANYGTTGVVRPFVENIIIDGGQGAPDFIHPPTAPQNQNPVVAHGIMLDGVDWEINNVTIRRIWGIGATGQTSVINPGGINFAQSGEIVDCDIVDCYTGIKINTSDSKVNDCTVSACRDYCLWITNNAGGIQSDHNHYYGAYAAIYDENGVSFRSSNDKLSDAVYGYLGGAGAHNVSFSSPTSIHCNKRHFYLAATTHIVDPNIEVWKNGSVHPDKAGIEIAGPRCTVIGGQIDVNWSTNTGETATGPATAAIIVAAGGHDAHVDTNINGVPGTTGETGVRVTAAVNGGRFEILAFGFGDAGDAAVRIEEAAAACKGTTWIIRGPTQNYVSLPAGFDASNKVTTINSTTGATTNVFP